MPRTTLLSRTTPLRIPQRKSHDFVIFMGIFNEHGRLFRLYSPRLIEHTYREAQQSTGSGNYTLSCLDMNNLQKISCCYTDYHRVSVQLGHSAFCLIFHLVYERPPPVSKVLNPRGKMFAKSTLPRETFHRRNWQIWSILPRR